MKVEVFSLTYLEKLLKIVGIPYCIESHFDFFNHSRFRIPVKVNYNSIFLLVLFTETALK